MRVVIAGGGTGGHLFPALAVREALVKRQPDAQALFVGATRGVEGAILGRLGLPFRGLEVSRISGAGLSGQTRTVVQLPWLVRHAARILQEFAPQVVLGVGGYASVPTVVAARLRRTSVVLHEQNAIPGLANRWLGRLAAMVAVSFPATARFFPVGRVAVTGNPVRAEIRPGDARDARARLGLSPDRLTVLIFGGSQGARRLNASLLEALPRLAAEAARIQFVHATGERDLAEVRAAYRAHGLRACAEPFFDDMATAYRAADFAICRAGAGTIFELAAMGKPALLVPYPYAANDHQRLNAEAMVTAGAAWTLPDDFCDGPRIAATLEAALEKPDLLRCMGEQARSLARPDAADRIVDLLERAAGRLAGC